MPSWNRLRLAQKLMVVLVPLSLVALLGLSFLNTRTAADLLEKEVLSGLDRSVRGFQQRALDFVTRARKAMDLLASSPSLAGALQEGQGAAFKELADRYHQVFPHWEDVGVIRNGSILRSRFAGMQGQNVSSRAFVQAVGKGADFVLSDPEQSQRDGSLQIFFARPLDQGDILYTSVSWEAFLKEFVDAVKVGETGYAYIVRGDGLVMAHPDRSNILKLNISGQEWSKPLLGGAREGNLSYVWEGEEKWVVFVKEELKDWLFVVGVTRNEVLGAVRDMEWRALVLALVFAALCILALTLTVNRILAPLRLFHEAFQRLGKGDLTRGMELDRGDELGHLAGAFNGFLKEMREMLQQVHSRAESVSSGATEISATAEELAATSEEQNQQTQSVVVSVNQLAATASDIARSVDLTSGSAEKAKSLTGEGQTATQSSLQGFEAIENESRQLEENIHALAGSVEKIGGILDVIRDVADQTNLLALNAAIEAARAGEAGRGFAVVADEVRKLAERTAGATGEIANLIQSIQAGAEQARTAMQGTRRQVTLGSQLSGEVMGLMEKVALSNADILEETRSVAAAVTEETATIDEINQNLQGMGTAAQESARAVHDVAQATENLAHDAENLKQMVERFRI